MNIKRFWWTTVLFFLIFIAVWIRLVDLQVLDYQSLKQKSTQQTQNTIPLPPRRGNLYDRNGSLLATSQDYYSLYAVPRQIKSPLELNSVAKILDLDFEKLQTLIQSQSHFVWIKRQISPSQKDKIQALKITGLHFVPEPHRLYLRNKLAGQVIGFVNIDGVGLAGLEYEFDQELKGAPGFMIVEKDATGQAIYAGNQFKKEPQHGLSLKLTLDETLQYLAEKELQQTIQNSKASWGCVLISDVTNGEILALANYPFFHPQKYSKQTQLQKNKSIQDVYEPGSTLKLATVAAILEEGLARPQTTYQNSYSMNVAGKIIREDNQDSSHVGEKTIADIIVHSLNIGAVKMGQLLGSQKLYTYLKKFKFGQKTHIALPGESEGILRSPDQWTEVDLATIPFGQGMAITPMQLLGFVSAIGNDGVYHPPKIIKEISLSTQGLSALKWIRQNTSKGERILSKRTSWELRKMMQSAVNEGTGIAAKIEGYTIGGKTGTAQKYNPHTKKYDTQRYVASFVGLAPIKRPKIAILVVIDSPQTSIYGSNIAAPAFKKIALAAFRLLNIPPDQKL